ncbi:HutD family protein [Marivita sp. S2033]|uniref:HutD/Ves family protein n=1 Tax=Marivita sp. S2033 TaxID=3373187 RepID=UPI00398299A2
MKILRRADLVDVPWKNGGGTTRNIAMALADTKTVWRLSRADVAQDGPFSNFAGLERILTIVSGGAMTLEHANGALHARLWEPVRFDGGLEVTSRLEDGPLTDLNLMFDPDLCDGMVTPHIGPMSLSVSPPDAGITVFHGLSGAPEIDGAPLRVGDTAFPNAAVSVNLSEGDALLEIALSYRDQSAAISVSIAER